MDVFFRRPPKNGWQPVKTRKFSDFLRTDSERRPVDLGAPLKANQRRAVGGVRWVLGFSGFPWVSRSVLSIATRFTYAALRRDPQDFPRTFYSELYPRAPGDTTAPLKLTRCCGHTTRHPSYSSCTSHHIATAFCATAFLILRRPNSCIELLPYQQ